MFFFRGNLFCYRRFVVIGVLLGVGYELKEVVIVLGIGDLDGGLVTKVVLGLFFIVILFVSFIGRF